MGYIEQSARGSIGRRYRYCRKPADTRAEETATDSAPHDAPLILLPPHREADETQLDEHADRARAVVEAFWHLRHFWP
jgi:hypothetical protein